MKLTKCPNNHYYNADKLPYCPHCINIENGIPIANLTGTDQADIETQSVHIIDGAHTLQQKTVGWLVCIEGNMIGESFILYDKANHIGRSPHMNICLSKEPTVSRDNHACISYDKDNKSMTISTGSNDAPVLLNDTPFIGSHPLHDRNLIQLGDCVLLYVALCNEHFSW